MGCCDGDRQRESSLDRLRGQAIMRDDYCGLLYDHYEAEHVRVMNPKSLGSGEG